MAGLWRPKNAGSWVIVWLLWPSKAAKVRLDAILTEGDAGAEIYAQRQRAGAEQLGIQFHLHTIPEDADEATVLACIENSMPIRKSMP